jgi:F-type H+-transporting ATPase subunit epsilon
MNFLDVVVLSPTNVLFEGKVNSVIVPGEQGTFEILPYHKRIVSRLIAGAVFVDERRFFINRGIIGVNQNKVTVILEEAVLG